MRVFQYFLSFLYAKCLYCDTKIITPQVELQSIGNREGVVLFKVGTTV